MAQDKKISKDQAIRHEYVRRQVLAGEVIVVYPPLAEPLISCSTLTRQATYPRFVATEQPEQARERIQLTVGGTRINTAGNRVPHVSPVLYSLEFRQAWKKFTDNSRS